MHVTFGQIKKRVLEQAGEDAGDIAEFDALIDQYVNEGYHYVLQRAYRPRGHTELYLEAGEDSVDARRIPRLLEIVEARADGRQVPFEMDGSRVHPLRAVEGELEITYVHDEPDLLADRDTPRLPAWSHGCLADYATWRFYSNGSLTRQSRAEFYRQRFMETFFRIRPEGEYSATVPNMHGLYDCT